jgi:hypothetical protein
MKKTIITCAAVAIGFTAQLLANTAVTFPTVAPAASGFQHNFDTLSTVNNITPPTTLLAGSPPPAVSRQAPPIALVVLSLCLVLIVTFYIQPSNPRTPNQSR